MDRLAEQAVQALDAGNVTVGILTALEEEYIACRDIFDPEGGGREVIRRATSGSFRCWVCSVASKTGGHHVVAIALLPDMGNNAAAITANMLLQHCPEIRQLIMCGIAGAVPHPDRPEDHVRLGDIVVTDRQGVIQYDRGKQRDPRPIRASGKCEESGLLPGFELRFGPRPPCPEMLEAVRRIHADELRLGKDTPRIWETKTDEFLDRCEDRTTWERPHPSKDKLNDSPGGTGPATRQPRDGKRRGRRPRVFRGPIASANIVLADPGRRDQLRDQYGVKAVEMEGSGLADVSWIANVPYLIVRGTCDYCDSTKNDGWHCHAALIAAAYTHTLLEYLPTAAISDSGSQIVTAEDLKRSRLASPPRRAQLDESPPDTLTLEPELPAAPHHVAPERTSQLGSTSALKHAGMPPDQADISQIPNHARDLLDTAAQTVPAPDEDRDRIVVLVNRLEKLLDELKESEVDSVAGELERYLEACPRKGRHVRAGWLILARVEALRLRNRRAAQQVVDITRLRRLREEAENVVD